MYICTECDSEFKTFDNAARCHYGIGGVVTQDEYIEMYGPLDSHNQVC